jgi:protein-disulfide isomerase
MTKVFAMFARTVAVAVAIAVALTMPAGAQSLPQQNQEILNELKAIRQLLEKLAGPLGAAAPTAAPAPPSRAPVPVNNNVTLATIAGVVLGRPDAPITMVEFTDLQCPFCRQFHVTAFEQIKKDYIDTGKVRYISRDLPLENLHPLAVAAARASRCAGEQGRFWEMRHAILINNARLLEASFAGFAQDLKLNVASFRACAADASKFRAEIQKDTADAGLIGITGTPTFVIGRTIATGLDGVRFVGAQPIAVFEAKFKELLSAP